MGDAGAMAGNSARDGVSVTHKVLALLRAFDAHHRELTLTELATRAQLPLATTHRLAGELVKGQALARTPHATYVVGPLTWDVGQYAPGPRNLTDVASPFLHDVYAATHATVHLAVREGATALYLARLQGNSSVPVVSFVGARLPLSTTGVGKALLAYAPDDVRREVMSDLQRPTAYSIVQAGQLARQLADVRRRGYAVTVQEMSLGTASVAVPVPDPHEQVVAAVGVVVRSLRRDERRLATALQVAARGIQRQLALGLPLDGMTS